MYRYTEGMGLTLISCVGFLLVTVILPLTNDYTTVTGLASLIAMCWLLFNILFNYVMVGPVPNYGRKHGWQYIWSMQRI